MSLRSLVVTGYVVATLGDILTTYIGLQNGLYENNHIATAFMDPHGAAGLAAAKIIIATTGFLVVRYAEAEIPDKGLMEVSLSALVTLWGMAATWNLYLILNFT